MRSGYQAPQNPTKRARKEKIYAEMDSLPHDPLITDVARHYARSPVGGRGSVASRTIGRGYIYIVTNPAWPDHVKIGMAASVDARLSSYQTSSPFRDYKLEDAVEFADMRAAEIAVHSALAAHRVSDTEWFLISIPVAAAELRHVKQNLEWAAS